MGTALCGACHISRGRGKSVSTRFKATRHKTGRARRKARIEVRKKTWNWGGRRDLNPRHSVPQTDALPAELLPPQGFSLTRTLSACKYVDRAKTPLAKWKPSRQLP